MSDVMTRLFNAFAGRYRLEREVGSGGMATVYLARDLKHDRDVAVKVLRPELAALLGVSRFLNEITICARLHHPHILTLIDSGLTGDPRDRAGGWIPYYVLPFVRGESLRDRLRREKQLDIEEALSITRQVTSALDYAHQLGVVHRDIKPENILIHEGEAMLSDFGIATAVKEAGGNRLTESGVSLGTPQYMSPEQVTGDRELDPRSDVYSMAAVVYEMLAGEPPHSGATVRAVIAKLLTERPTPLRVIRDTVPERVDAAVAKALAKLPADRYGSAGEFARALLTGEPPARTSAESAASRRWTPPAIAAGIAVAVAIGTASIFARPPASAPVPDRVQLTLTGNARAPSLSPDGTRLAFAEKQCDSAGGCTFQLVIQDLDGTGRLVVARNIGYVYTTRWISDGRLVQFSGSYPPLRQGAFAVSTLGGEPRYLGCCWFDLVSGDTALLSGSIAPVDRAWVRRITVRDGLTLDSVPVFDQGEYRRAGSGERPGHHTIALTIPDRLIVVVRKNSESGPELRLTDFRGRVVDRLRPPSWSHNFDYPSRWVPSRQKLVIAAQRELGNPEYDILAMQVTPSRIGPGIDTVVSGVQLGAGFYDISADGERLVLSAGLVETSLSTIDLDRTSPKRLAATQVLSSTTFLRGQISPAGDRLLLARDAARSGAHGSQFSILPRNGGPESQIPGVVENLLDHAWSPDGARIMYLHGVGGSEVRLIERDTTGRETREIARLEQSAAVRFDPLPDGAVSLLPADSRSISIIRRPGKHDVTWRLPEWMRRVGSISHSPDAKSLAVVGMSRLADSVVVATVDIESGHFTRIGVFAGSDPLEVTWLEDGSIMAIFREPQGAWVLYRFPPGRPAEKLGTLPDARADFSVSSDGRHVAMFSYVDKRDVYMIRNFGRMLRQ